MINLGTRFIFLALLLAFTTLNLIAQRPEDNPDRGRSQQEEFAASDLREGKHQDQTFDAFRELNPFRGNRMGFSLTTGGTTATSPISNHGGRVMGTPAIYIIFYGNWNQGNGSDTAAGKAIITDWAQSIGTSGPGSHYAINASYGTTGQATYGGSVTLTGAYNKRLKDSDILAIVDSTVRGPLFPFNPEGVYFLVTSSDVTATSGFCTRYCGWHTHSIKTYGDLIYSFVGNSNRCLSGCAAQSISPNGNPGVDGSISVLTHELEEAHTDPDLNAWYDSGGAENADKCAWTFGHAQYAPGNGSFANMHVGSRDYLIQRNLWHTNSGDFCMVNTSQD